jgi:oligopeptide transport system permease protein
VADFEAVASNEVHSAAPGVGGAPGAPGQPSTLDTSTKPRSAAQDAWRELRRRPLFWLAILIALVALVMAVWPSLFTSADPGDCALSRQNHDPSGVAIFGYDELGCDVFAKAVYGAQNSLKIGFLSALLAGALGLTLGLLAGYLGRWVDAVISRAIDIVLGLPLLLAGLVAMNRVKNAGAGQSVQILALVAVLGGLGWTTAARVIRSSVITAKQQDYVTAARMLGAGDARIMWRHILPNALAPFTVVITIALGLFIASEATLSYLGVGIQPPAQSWGLMIAQTSAIGLVRTNPIPLVVPSTFLALTVLAFIILGDTIREAFDPKLR